MRWECPTYPFQITSIDQVFPSRQLLEVFEARRNEMDKRMGSNKLETVQAFYCPSSPEVMNGILTVGFHQTFLGELTFCTDAPQAIRETLATKAVNKLILARVCLGWRDFDYAEINNKYRIKNLRSVLPAFVITFQSLFDSTTAPVRVDSAPNSYVFSVESSAPINLAPVRLPKYITDLDKITESSAPPPQSNNSNNSNYSSSNNGYSSQSASSGNASTVGLCHLCGKKQGNGKYCLSCGAPTS